MTSANPEPLSQAEGPSRLPTDADSDLADVVNRASGVSLERVARAAEAMVQR
ncbi:hypothetical protein [Streptomyces avidinii]|uniref:Uncharacterized protein n=1 Tax=Streptomyces avidinii TaxID=1895 RepID=A0ABS4KZD0_STRAV|nr:hypothetical protein [Streptomyces avidinii]MBP2034871.1 hypothetical protein [Streptomyces avidinii]GGY89508.1 hypothetical protein GCM10010343_13460 [Streptomyces avidinii]